MNEMDAEISELNCHRFFPGKTYGEIIETCIKEMIAVVPSIRLTAELVDKYIWDTYQIHAHRGTIGLVLKDATFLSPVAPIEKWTPQADGQDAREKELHAELESLNAEIHVPGWDYQMSAKDWWDRREPILAELNRIHQQKAQ